MRELTDDEIPTYTAYGNTVAEADLDKLPEANRRNYERMQRLREIVKGM